MEIRCRSLVNRRYDYKNEDKHGSPNKYAIPNRDKYHYWPRFQLENDAINLQPRDGN